MSSGPGPGQPTRTQPSNFPPSRRWLLVPLVAAAVVPGALLATKPGPSRTRALATAPASTVAPTSTSTSTTSTTGTTTTTVAPTTSTSAGPAIQATSAPPGPTSPPALVNYPGAPGDLSPLAADPFFGEGHWVPAGRFVAGAPAIWTTTLRPPSGGNAVGIARLDTDRLTITPYAGTTQPGGTWMNQGSIPADRQRSLVAAFNGGFQFNSSEGGFYADGHANPPLRDGAASLVEFLDGSATVGQWGRDVALGPYVIAVRQNLPLLVDGGKAVPAASNNGRWGATLGGVSATWRSAVGSDDNMHLYYVGGPGLTAADLAAVLVHSGAQRAMEFDINPQWVIFASFTDSPTAPNQTFGAKLLPTMNYGADHFFSPDWRDFVGVFAKEPAPAPPPPKGTR